MAPVFDVGGAAAEEHSVGALASDFENTIGFTVETWIRPTNNTGSGVIFDVYPHDNPTPPISCNGNERSVMFFQNGADLVIYLSYYDASRTCGTCTVAGAIAAGALTHLALVSPVADGEVVVYINADPVNCTEGPISVTAAGGGYATSWQHFLGNARQVALGALHQGGSLWDGRMYLWALYPTALSAAALSTNLAAGEYNHVPAVVSFAVVVDEEAEVVIVLSGTDPYDDVLFARIETMPAVGTLVQFDGSALGNGVDVTDLGGRVKYRGPTDAFGSALASFTFTISDSEARSDVATVTVDVNNVNDDPTLDAPVTASGAFGALFSIGGISVDDPDALVDTLKVTLFTDAGLLTIEETAGLTFLLGNGVDDTAMIFYGTKDACNAGLASLAYDALTMGGGADTLTARVDDDNGGAEQTAVVALTVTSSC